MSSLTSLVAIAISLGSGYATYQSVTSIQNVQKYEEKAEKAAEWSKTAEKRLWDTRYTIGTGFVSVCHMPPPPSEDVCADRVVRLGELIENYIQSLVSLLTALAYFLFVPSGSSVLSAPFRSIWPAILAVALRFGASKYMYNFWATKAKMPLVDQYNMAISQSMEVIGFLDVLAVGWGILAALKALAL